MLTRACLIAAALLSGCRSTPTPTSSSSGSTATSSGGGSSSGSSGSSSTATASSSSSGGIADAGPPLTLLGILPNPHSVLTAIVEGEVDRPMSVYAEITQVGADAGSRSPLSPATTPMRAVGPGAFSVPVVGLQPSSSYAISLAGLEADGGLEVSAAVSFTTGVIPPQVTQVATFAATTFGPVAAGDILVAKNAPGMASPPYANVIVDRQGQVVWYALESQPPWGDFQQQPDGTYSIALPGAPFSIEQTAQFLVVDLLGNPLATYTVPAPDSGTDGHELRETASGDILLLGGVLHLADLSPYGGQADGEVLTSTLYRLDRDGGVVFAWDSFGALDLGDVDTTLSGVALAYTDDPLDAVHANSIDIASDGNYLVSARHLSQVWKVSAATGDVLWKLGRHGDFTFVGDPFGGPSGQHFARETAPDRILLFDDGNGHDPPLSRAVEYQLAFADLPDGGNTATRVWSYTPTPNLFTSNQGSAQRLPNGDTLIAYGSIPRIDEVDADGGLVWQLSDTSDAAGYYRAFVVPSLY